VEIIRADAHNVTVVELSAPPQLRLTVDGHVTAADQGLGIRSVRGSTGKLEQLAKADHVTGDFDRSLHTESVAGSIWPGDPESCAPLSVGLQERLRLRQRGSQAVRVD
jgi:hypothetical protein